MSCVVLLVGIAAVVVSGWAGLTERLEVVVVGQIVFLLCVAFFLFHRAPGGTR